MAPPCTSFGPWARLNKLRSPEKWAESNRIGRALAALCAQICSYQLAMKRHFLIENPLGSELWKLHYFDVLRRDQRICEAVLHQCQVGLVDPEGVPTLKPTLMVASSNTLVRRLRLRCPGLHRHALLAGSYKGIARCRFAQVWPVRLTQLIADGVAETIKKMSAFGVLHFPVRKAPDIQDPFDDRAKPASATCPGCVAHSRKDDPRHDRRVGICRFPYDEAANWQCPACKANRPSTHAAHMFDDSCQWTDAQVRKRGVIRTPGLLREPRMKEHEAPKVATPESAEEPPQDWQPLQI